MFFQHTYDRVFLPIQKLIKGQKYRRKCVDNKSRNLFGTTAKKGGILMQRGNVGGNLFSLIRSRIWLPISFALQNFGAYSHLFSWKFHLLPQYKTPRKSRCKKISINARKENHVPFSSSFRKSVEPKVGEELSTWRLQCNYYSRDKMRRL